MTDTVALKKVMIRLNISVSFISGTLGITNEAFLLKMSNICEFLASEIVYMKQMLNLTNTERDKDFFKRKVELNSTKEIENF